MQLSIYGPLNASNFNLAFVIGAPNEMDRKIADFSILIGGFPWLPTTANPMRVMRYHIKSRTSSVDPWMEMLKLPSKKRFTISL
jgi:hypothetical protein